MSSENLYEYITTKVYDVASKTGSLAARYIREKTQISNILSIFESETNPEEATKMTITFIARQMSRREIDSRVAIPLITELSNLYKNFKGESLRIAVRKFLYIFKWIYESEPHGEINNFNDFIQSIVRGR
jgi:hypothetical protein